SSASTISLFGVPRIGAGKTFAQVDGRFPAEQPACTREVATAAHRVVDRQWFERDLRAGTRDVQYELRELEHRVLAVVADVHRLDDVAVGEREDASHFVVDVTERPRLRPV